MGRLFGCISELLVFGSCFCAVITNSLLLYSCDLITIANSDITNTYRGSLGLYRANLFDYEHSSDNNDVGGDGADNEGSYYNGCIIIDKIPGVEDMKDIPFNCARVCAVLASICGATLLVFGFFKQYIYPLPFSQVIMDICGGTIQIFLAGLGFIMLTSLCDDNQCSYGQGETYLILTKIFWLTAACFTRCMRPGRYERRKERLEEEARTRNN